MPIDHMSIAAPADVFEATVACYVEALRPMGYAKIMEFNEGTSVGLGLAGGMKADFWVVQDTSGTRSTPVHFALSADNHKIVDECHAAAIVAGGRDNGAPGPRDHYHPGYYAGFFYDPCGNNVEVVDHGFKH